MAKDQKDIESWHVDDIRPYPGNAKIHSDEQIASIARSISRFGFDQPIVVDGAGIIIKGHGRHAAAKTLGMSKVPVIVRHDLTANEADASRLADNRVAVGDVDTNLIHQELEKLAYIDDTLLAFMGFTEKELDFMTSDLGEMDASALLNDAEINEVVSEALTDSKKMASSKVSLKEIFGVGEIDGERAKKLARWLNSLAGEYDTDVVDGLMQHIDELDS